MLILEWSQGCYRRTDGRMDGSVTLSLRNFVGKGIKKKNHINSGYLKKIYVKLRLVIMKNLQAMLMQGGDLNKKK